MKKKQNPFIYNRIKDRIKIKYGKVINIKQFRRVVSLPLCITKEDASVILKELEKFGIIEYIKDEKAFYGFERVKKIKIIE